MTEPAAARRASIASDSAYSLGLRACLYLTAFGASVLISRVLGPGGRGLYYLPVVTAATLAAFGSLGLEFANIFLYGNGRASLERLWRQSGLVAAVGGGAGLVLAVAAPLALPRLYVHTPTILLVLAGLTIPFTLHTNLAAGLLVLQGRVAWQFGAGLVGSFVQIAALAGLLLSGRLDVASVLAAGLVSGAVTWWLVARRAAPAGSAWIGWDPPLLRETVRQSVPLHLTSILLFLHLRVDMFMVSGFAGASALGIYSLAVTLAETVQLATDSLNIAVLPRLVGNTVSEAAELALRGARTAALIGFALAAAWAAAGFPLIVLAFGRPFASAYLPLVLLLPGVMCLGVQRACGGAVLRRGLPWVSVAILGASLACNTALNLWLIPAFGAAGAAVASTVSYTSATMAFLVWTSRLAGVPVRRGAIPTVADARNLWRSAKRALSTQLRGDRLDASV